MGNVNKSIWYRHGSVTGILGHLDLFISRYFYPNKCTSETDSRSEAHGSLQTGET